MSVFDFEVPDDAYRVITPLGVIAAYFSGDGPVLWTGPEAARQYFAYALLDIVLPGGYGLTMDGMQEEMLWDLRGQLPDELGILISEPVEYEREEVERIRRGEKPIEVIEPGPIGVQPQWPVMEPRSLDDF